VRIGRATGHLKERALVVHSAPLCVGFADELLQETLRRQKRWDILRKRGEGLVAVAIEQALREAATQDDSQHTWRVDQVTKQVRLDFEFCLLRNADRCPAFHEVPTG